MAKKPKSPPMVMKQRDVDRRLRLLRNWDWLCVLCGHPFDSLESVSVEHLMPKSKVKNQHHNHAPSHYNCNRFRGDVSLLDACYIIARKRRVIGPRAFHAWINVKVPHRVIPDQFMRIRTLPPELTLPGFEFINLPMPHVT